MIGCPVFLKCLVACLFFESSQQPTCPHARQRRRCTQVSPAARHSSQPSVLGVSVFTKFKCVHAAGIAATSPFVDEDASRMLSPRGCPACTADEPGTYSAAANSVERRMTKGRLEAFTDGVIAVIITIMVLELKVPHDADPEALVPLIPVFLSYVLSFVYTGIYWNNHHHMLHATRKVTGLILWANLHLLFWLSLVPFTTGWMGENHFESAPTALYGAVLLMAAIAYWMLQQAIIAADPEWLLKRAVGGDWKGRMSPAFYVTAIGVAFWQPWMSLALYALVALVWLVPDRRIEHVLVDNEPR